ncbi:MAG: ABC transporter ATP-binding protein [Anaerolineales bacterium]|jgi:iron complex transport system ATP-binding protein|nr:ABC transporter ATP-binding protein [Anaerolineales bacterium]
MSTDIISTGLQVQGLSVRYGRQVIVDDVSFRVAPGEVLALIGPNGAGKTTLIKALSGIIPAFSGRAYAMGQDLLHLPPAKRAALLSVVPQARALPESFTVWQTTLMGRTPYLGWLGKPAAQDIERVHWALEQSGLASLSQRRVGKLSGGEQQRVLVARALAQHTPILLLDEPTAHLDLRYQTELLSLVRQLAAHNQLTVLMALHDLNQVGFYADHVALLVNGRLAALGTPLEVLTPERLADAYHVPLRVLPHPDTGAPLVLPER